MPTVIPDVIRESLVDNGVDGVRVVRHMIVKDLPVIGTGEFASRDSMALIKALGVGGMPQLYESHPSRKDLTVRRHIIRGQSNDQANVMVVYETPQNGVSAPTGVLIVQDDTQLTSETVQINPATGEPLIVKMTPSGGSEEVAKQITTQRLVPLRNLILTGILQESGSQPATDQAKRINTAGQLNRARSVVGSVNRQPWAGLRVGCWLCSGFTAETTDLGQYYRVRASFLNRDGAVWWQYGWWRNALGELDESTTTPGNIANIEAAINNTRYAPGNHTVAIGFRLLGLYPLGDFNGVFGAF